MNELRETIAEVEPDARSEMLLAREPMTTPRDAPIAIAMEMAHHAVVLNARNRAIWLSGLVG